MGKPKIRFKGYEDDWEQRKWIDVVDISTEMVNPTTGEYDNMPHIAPGNIESFTGRILDNVKTVKEEQLISGKFRFRPDDVVYGKINPQLGKYFYATVNGLTSADAYVFNGKNGLKQKFLFALLQTSDFFKYSVSVSKRSGMPKINRDELNAYSFLMPSEEEQDRIGSYLLQLDHLITLHQRKCYRFIDIALDAWEQRKLSDIYASIGNAFVGTATPYYVESGHFYLESNNIKDGQINHNSEIFINDEFYEKQKDKWLHTGDMVMVQSGHVGHAAVIPEELDNSAAHALIMFRHPKEKIEPYFLNYQYQTNKSKKKIEEITTGNTIKHILASDMQEFVVDITNYDEQKKIGSYFQKLDHLITLHQRKCYRFIDIALDAWEQRKLGEVAQEFKSGNSLKADEIDITGDYPVYGGNGLRGYTSTYNHDGEYALIGRQGALCGNMNYSVGKAYFTEHAVVVKADENNDTRFLYYMLDTMNLGQYSDQSAQPGLAVNKLVKLENQFPMKEEQQRIGWYFSNIDHLITLHQRKCEETKSLKKYMLQKMFPENGNCVPKIRFSGFADAWEQRKLKDYLEVSREKNKTESYGKEDVLSVSGEHGIVNQIEFQGRSFAGVSVANYGVVEAGDVVYTKSPLKSNPYGIIKTNKGKTGIVSTLYAVYKPRMNTNSEFVQIYFELDSRMNSYMHPLVNKGAKNDMKVSDENALKGPVAFPELEEQNAITQYFDKLDRLITLHQHKCDELQKLKKFMLQNMFV